MTERAKASIAGPAADLPWADVAVWTQAVASVQNWRRFNGATLSRLSSHLILILLAVAAIGLSRVELPSLPATPAEAGTEVEDGGDLAPTLANGSAPLLEQGTLIRAAVPRTTIPDRSRQTVSTYKVQSGDTLSGIAVKFGLKLDTLVWSNPSLEDYPDLLHVGYELTIIPIDGVYHEVKAGDTVDGLAKKYKSTSAAIINCELNGLDKKNPQLTVGSHIIVPDGVKPYIARVVHAYNGPIPKDAEKGTGSFGWPISGPITQGYNKHHRAVDVGASRKTPVRAADSGWVAQCGWSDVGYGYFILIDHGNGYQTLYAHLDELDVKAGQSVSKGAVIAKSGATGNVTGPHLHFEIRKDGTNRNPFGFLP